MEDNPLLNKFNGKFNAIPFSKFTSEHFLPAIDKAIDDAKEEISCIKDSSETPNFENTIVALELTGESLHQVTNIYYNLYSLESDNDFKTLAETISPKTTAFQNSVYTDSVLFDRVNSVWNKRDKFSLDNEDERLLEKTYKTFIRNGANLNDSDKEKLNKIDEELSTLSPQFSKNCLNAMNDYFMYIDDENKLSGLPDTAKVAAQNRAKEKNYETGWVFNLQMPSYIPVMKYLDDRSIREELAKQYHILNISGEFNNLDIIKKILELRYKRSKLLGYKNHSYYILEERMASNPETVYNFLDDIYKIAYPKAKDEVKALEDLAKELNDIETLQPWDVMYYSEKLKKKLFDFDSEKLRNYFKAESVISGIFEVANRLYNLSFNEINEIDKYHSDVKTYSVTDNNKDELIGLLYIDLYPRETKRSGAWMNTFRTQGLSKQGDEIPHILISGNLTPSNDDFPSLLSFDEVRTVFHEFGHALHGLLSNTKYKSLASPNVLWDFVELPSQIMENWLLEEETLKIFAQHWQTGEIIPIELIEKVKKASQFNAAYMNIRQLNFGYLDMAWHNTDPASFDDVISFEKEVCKKTRLLPEVDGSMSAKFSHIFAGGYSSGYYSYKWAEVLDADSFNLFKEKGIFNREVSEAFREHILSKGNSVAPMELYKKFRGQEPDVKALLKRDGLI